MGVACFRRSYSKTRSSGGGGGEGGGELNRPREKKGKTRGNWGAIFPPQSLPSRTLFFFLVKFLHASYYFNAWNRLANLQLPLF